MPNLIRALTKEEYFVQFKYLLLKINIHWAREMNRGNGNCHTNLITQVQPLEPM